MPRGRKPKDRSPYVPDPTDNLFPEHEWDYVNVAAERVKLAWENHHFMNPDGRKMLLAFSGGKDSVCLFFVAKQAAEEMGLRLEDICHVQYNVTTVDPPELVYFVRDVMKRQYPYIEMRHPEKTMWELIVEKHQPPLRNSRYCCAILKESSTVRGGYTLTGVRRAESWKRSSRKGLEIRGDTKAERFLLNDNGDDRRRDEYCMQKRSYICNPIIDWTDDDVWHYIKGRGLPYCELYDKGWDRLGCLGCPLAGEVNQRRDFEAYPRYKEQYIRTFQKMLDVARGGWYRPEMQSSTPFLDGQDVFDWWTHDPAFIERHQDELSEKRNTLFDDFEEET